MSTTNREKRKQAKRKARERSKGRGRTATKAAALPAPPAARFFEWDPEYHATQDAETRGALDQMHQEALLDREDAEYLDLYRKLAAGPAPDGPPTYLRFGDLPPDGRSQIWCPQGGPTREKGVSVFAGRFTGDGHYLLDLDNTLQYTLTALVEDGGRPAYFVRGRRVGSGINGEPLLRDVDHMESPPDDCLILTKTPSRIIEDWNARAFGDRLGDIPELSRYLEGGPDAA